MNVDVPLTIKLPAIVTVFPTATLPVIVVSPLIVPPDTTNVLPTLAAANAAFA